MSSSQPSQTAKQGGRRARVSHACVACQQKKQKCDGQTPACRNCLRANRTCVNNDPSTQRHHPRGYIEFLEQHNASLENHVAFLESTLQQHQPGIDLDNLQDGVTGQQGSPHHEILTGDPQRASTNSENPSNTAVAAVTESPLVTNNSAPLVTNNSTQLTLDTQITDDERGLELLYLRSAGAEPHFFGASSGYSFTKMFSASLRAVRQQAPGLSMLGITDKAVSPRPSPMRAALPERAIVNMLTTAYFEQVHPQFPFLHRPSYLQWEEEVLSATEQGKTPDPVQAFFVYALCAIGALTGSYAGGPFPEGSYAAAESLFEHVMQQNTITSIQAILACAMYSLRSPIGVSIWMLSGLALRQCVELGLHRKIRWAKVEPDYVKAELRKRVFWCSYNLDRAVAITLGRPVGIADHDIDVEFPSDLDDEDITIAGPLKKARSSHLEPVTTMSSAIHTIRLRQLWARMQSEVYPQVGADREPQRMEVIQQLKTEFSTWLEMAPEQLASNRANNNAFGSHEWFTLMYHHSCLLLYRHRLVHRFGSTIPPSVFIDCAHASQSICIIYRQLYISQRLNDTWGALHVLFLAAVTFLHCLWSSAETRALYRLDKVSSICTSIMIVLVIMAERWSAAEAYRDAFDMLASATQTMLAEMTAASAVPNGPIIASGEYDQFTDYLSYMSEVGMCPSVEELLANMVD